MSGAAPGLNGMPGPPDRTHSIDPAAARARAASSFGKLERSLSGKIEALRRALGRTALLADAAVLAQRLATVEARVRGLSRPAEYLRASREIAALWQGLCTAETERSASEQRARAALSKVACLIGELLPGRGQHLVALLNELPIDLGMGERLEALLLLVHARREIVPRLMAARSIWKK